MSSTVHLRPLNNAVVQFIKQLGFKADLSKVPADKVLITNSTGAEVLGQAYAIVYPRTTTSSRNPVLAWPDRFVAATIQVTSVGRNDDHAQDLADIICEALLERSQGGGFVNPLTAPGLTVSNRLIDERGLVQPAGGDLWQVDDLYNLEVEASA